MDPGHLHLRPARMEEAAVVAKLANVAYGRTEGEVGWTSEQDLIEGSRIDQAGVEALIQDEGTHLLVAMRGGQLVGCVQLDPGPERSCELGLFSVDPALQGQGIGRTILSQAEAYARDHLGARRMVMHVVSVREKLLAWYRRRGYEPTGDEVPFEPFGDQRFLQGPLSFKVLAKELS
ncbi:MAG: GNAT family N-acetyltransferase [Candidatus Thermoplasmatota archaeon]|nr:GNAT family N-acetyltransferase [Candidatus Thermoplasmatota archaeon]